MIDTLRALCLSEEVKSLDFWAGQLVCKTRIGKVDMKLHPEVTDSRICRLVILVGKGDVFTTKLAAANVVTDKKFRFQLTDRFGYSLERKL